jgi:lipopolysaccharide/colanic/teichoic acid biosynthesis glycosyltransferase
MDVEMTNDILDSSPQDILEVAGPQAEFAPRHKHGLQAAARPTIPVCPCPSWKRLMDVAVAGLALILLLPLLALVAAWIKVVSPGPMFFRQLRYGLAGRPFQIWKFRTLEVNEAHSTQRDYMVELMESEQLMVKRDPQLAIIPGGRLLRNLGIDELPHLVNVLKGEMSLVGPRPHVLPLQSYADWQQRRFEILPGITGLWQISDKQRTTFSTMMQMDIDYLCRRSLWLDLSIMLQTIPAIARYQSDPIFSWGDNATRT